MCGGAQFEVNGQTIKTFFPNPKARLPVLSRAGQPVMVPWGRREQQTGRTPLGGWARIESIRQGIWQRFQPRPVKISVEAFMEKNTQDHSEWFLLDSTQCIQGLLATDGPFQRLYVVTEPHPSSTHVSERWPRLIHHPNPQASPNRLL